MKSGEERITSFLHGSAATPLIALAALLAGWCAWSGGDYVSFSFWKGLGLPSPSLWAASASTSFVANILVVGLTAGMMIVLNMRFNLLRDITRIYAALFLLMMASQPSILCCLNSGSILALAAQVCILLLYTTYNRPSRTKQVFLVFCILAGGAMCQYAFIAYIPIFLMGVAQMRVFAWRSFMAAILGIITPFWIAIAFGVIHLSTFRGPDFVSFTSGLSDQATAQFYATVGFTMACGMTLCIVNLVKVFSYNSRSRSYNGFIALLLFSTCLLMAVDFTNITSYLPLLFACTAYQVAQFFVINIKKRSYIAVVGIILAYATLYGWWMLL